MIQNRIRKKQLDYTWPGFVDALSSLLMVIIFVLMIFVISQFFISQKMSGQDEALIKLKNNLIELSELLSLERDTTTALTAQLSVLEEKFTVIKEDLIKERAINLEVAQNKTAKAAIVKDGSALQAQLTRQLDLEEKSLNVSKSRTKELGLQQLIESEKIKKDPALLNALQHALELQKEVTKQMESQLNLALRAESIRRQSLLNAQHS